MLFIHWIADFVLQTETEAKNKSKNFKYLLLHTFSYTLIWFVFCLIYVGVTGNERMLFFVPITFFTHTFIDYYTSKVNTLLAQEAKKTNKYHNFFVSIGFDQWLHFAQLILTFTILK